MSLVCWKCGASLAGKLLPLSRLETCPSCRTDLHVCRQCRHFDAHRAGQCRELAAERVADKTRANDCGWFVPRLEAYKGGGAAMAQASRSALDALFAGKPAGSPGDEPVQPVPPASLDDLFRK
jgi:ribosomal protein L40E